MMSSISEASKEDENEKDTNEKIVNINITNKNFFNIKMAKIKDEIKDYIIDKYAKIIYKQNKELERIKKQYDDLVKKSSNILKIIINNKMINDKVDKNKSINLDNTTNSYINEYKIENNNSEKGSFKNKFVKNKTYNRINKNIDISNDQLAFINMKKKHSYKAINNNNNFNKTMVSNKIINSNRINKKIIDFTNKENISNISNLNKNHININYLKELNNKDYKKIKFIKQKLLNNTNNGLLNTEININFKQKPNNINSNRNKRIDNKNNINTNKGMTNSSSSFYSKNYTSFNTPRKMKENELKINNQIVNVPSSLNIRNIILNEKYGMKLNPISNFNVNELNNITNKVEEQVEGNIIHRRFFSHNNSFIKNQNENEINGIGEKNDFIDEKSQIIFNPKFISFLNRYDH
jgi:hypothetical protein